MKKVFVLVEGQTEELFVEEVLQPALPSLALIAVIIATKRVASGGKFKGGIGSFKKVADHLRLLLSDSSAAAVTTLLDLYGLPHDFPGAESVTQGRERAVQLEAALYSAMGSSPRLIPHFSVHEFESYLFVSPEASPTVFSPEQARRLSEISKKYGGDVELINDGPSTHPSARIQAIAPGYDKVFGGSLAIGDVGLDRIANACPHFKAWFDRLAAL